MKAYSFENEEFNLIYAKILIKESDFYKYENGTPT